MESAVFLGATSENRILMQIKLKFRDAFRSYVKSNFDAELGQLPPSRTSKLMTRFYVRAIQGVITPALVPKDEDDFENCVIDAKDDCGVDFLSRADGMVLLIQAKFRGYGASEKPDEVSHFCDLLRRLHPDTGGDFPKNQRLLEALSDIDWENDLSKCSTSPWGVPAREFAPGSIRGLPSILLFLVLSLIAVN